LLQKSGDKARAREHLADAVRMFREMGMVGELARADGDLTAYLRAAASFDPA
jgi:hypothetical protein